MTLEEMNHKMLVQILSNQLGVMMSHSGEYDGSLVCLVLAKMTRRTYDLLSEIKEAE